jgi:hypothetical protein
MSFGFTRRPSPAQQRRNKARRLVNLSVHEVSSVDSGAGMGCEVKLMKHAPRGGLGVDETEKMNMDLNTAYRVSKLMSLDKVFNDHSAGKISGALMSDAIRALANAEFPNDPKAMMKYEKAHREEFANKLRSDYARQQKDGYGAPLGIGSNWNGAVGSGAGTAPRVQGNTYSGSAVDSQFSASPFANAPSAVDTSKRYANAITKDNIDTLMKKFGLSFDAAATMLARGGK